jgi:hypothetical protein
MSPPPASDRSAARRQQCDRRVSGARVGVGAPGRSEEWARRVVPAHESSAIGRYDVGVVGWSGSWRGSPTTPFVRQPASRTGGGWVGQGVPHADAGVVGGEQVRQLGLGGGRHPGDGAPGVVSGCPGRPRALITGSASERSRRRRGAIATVGAQQTRHRSTAKAVAVPASTRRRGTVQLSTARVLPRRHAPCVS